MTQRPSVNPDPAGAIDELLRTREAAEALTIGERTLQKLTQEGKVECIRIGRSVRYSRAALAAFLAKGGAR